MEDHKTVNPSYLINQLIIHAWYQLDYQKTSVLWEWGIGVVRYREVISLITR